MGNSKATKTSRPAPRSFGGAWYPPAVDTGVEVRAHRGRRLRLLFCPGAEQSFLAPWVPLGTVVSCSAYRCKAKRHTVISLRQAFVQEVIEISPGLSGVDTNVGLDRVVWQAYPDLRKELARRGREDDKQEESERRAREAGPLRLVRPVGGKPSA